MFYPREIIFAPSNRCNLKCRHCFLSDGGAENAYSAELSAEDACSFLTSCANAERNDLLVGFSGGEPFLRLDFLCAVSRRAVELDFLFSRVITNGVFASSEKRIRADVGKLRDSGFDGKIALSFDSFHGQSPEAAAFFIRTVIDVFGDSSAAEIWSVIPAASGFDGRDEKKENPHDEKCCGRFLKLAELLDADIEPFPFDAAAFSKPGRFVLRGKDFFVPVYRNRQSFGVETMRWDSKQWFTDDLCEGPGHCFFVHPDGNVAPCCGFANHREVLKIGRLDDGYETLMRNASTSAAVDACYRKGLNRWRREREKEGVAFPGRTDDICAFCDYLCSTGRLGADGVRRT